MYKNQDRFYFTIVDNINSDGLYKPCLSIYFNGCDKPVKCKNCQNPELQKPFVGYSNTLEGLINELNQQIILFMQYHKQLRIAFVGGEPLSDYNIKAVLEVSKFIKQNYKNSITIIYSWRMIEDIFQEQKQEFLKYIDYGVLGEFIQDSFEKDTIPASKNQYIYSFKEHKKMNKLQKGDINGRI